MGADPGELEVGNLADDWEFVSSLSQANAPPVAFQLTELAPLLAYVGEALADQLSPRGGSSQRSWRPDAAAYFRRA